MRLKTCSPAAGAVRDAAPGPTAAGLDRALAARGISNVGPPMGQAEPERLLGQLAGTVTR